MNLSLSALLPDEKLDAYEEELLTAYEKGVLN
jgi:hypothetical protein